MYGATLDYLLAQKTAAGLSADASLFTKYSDFVVSNGRGLVHSLDSNWRCPHKSLNVLNA
jgi:hypothetical protein